MSESNGDNLKTFSTGAVRSKDADDTAYSLISPIAQEAEARVLAKGAVKYGDYNWEKGMPVRECLEHALRHINLYLGGDRSEPHLAHARTNLGFAIHSDAKWPDLNQDLRRDDCIPPNVDDATAASWRNLADNLRRMKEDVQAAAEGAERTVGPVAGKQLWTGDFVHVADDGKVYPSMGIATAWGEIPDLFSNGAAKPRVPTKYHILPVYGYRGLAVRYKLDLESEGHEVVSRWIEGDIDDDNNNDFDLQSADVAIVLMEGSFGSGRIRYARSFAKPIVAIGPQPDDFPDHGRGERWFPSWPNFMTSLAWPGTAREESPSAR